jgi:glycosyltransferase involved in cell wall biosynthesis
MRFHVVSLPHTHTTKEFSVCAYTEKVRKFCRMMKERGHTVYLYAGEFNEAPCDEHIVCVSDEYRRNNMGKGHYVEASFDPEKPLWRVFNTNATNGIKERAQPHDFICVIGGCAHKPIADALPGMMTVEFGIGYGGSFAPYRVWESYAWMHTCYGSMYRNPHDIDGRWFDAVIPNYFEPEDFPLRTKKDDYCLFIGRLIDRKGYKTATDVCEHMAVPLKIAGHGVPPAYGEYVGVVGPKERGELMSRAKAVFVPTQYIEPFGGVAVEAMLCGTPVITTDFGAFTETVIQGVTGFRCRNFVEFCEAVDNSPNLNPERIREHAMQYSLDSIAPRYEAYFERLTTLWGDGWYAGKAA